MKTKIPSWKKWFVYFCTIPLSSCSSGSSTEGDTYRFVIANKWDLPEVAVSFLPDGRIHMDKYCPDSKFESLDITCLRVVENLREDGSYTPDNIELFFPEKTDPDWPSYPVNPSFWESTKAHPYKFQFFKNGCEIPKKEAIGLRGLGIVEQMQDWDSKLRTEFHDEAWNIQIHAEKSPLENHVRVNGSLTHAGSDVVYVSQVLIYWWCADRSTEPKFYSNFRFDPPCENIVPVESKFLSWAKKDGKTETEILARHSLLEGNEKAFDFSVDLQNPYTDEELAQKKGLCLEIYFELYELEDETVAERGYSLTRAISVGWRADTIRSILNSKEACAE